MLIAKREASSGWSVVGATRTSLVAYLLAVVGILLGSAMLKDPLTANRIAGTVLVIAGIALVNSGAAIARVIRRSPPARTGEQTRA